MTTAELDATNFSDFFTALWGKKPFSWQRELAKRVVKKSLMTEDDASGPAAADGQTPWPGAIALPTASGKTACIDIAVFALASQAFRITRKLTLTAPRRIFFVVDRRVIVDEAYERAFQLAKKLENAREGILKDVADNLRLIARGETTDFNEERPLATHILRGGMYRSEAWARNPLQPTIVASTVDQVGSRLLFRAYGRGSGTWPIYAGIIANDSLILLDEAHCAQPFLQTLQAVQRYQTWAHEPLKRPFYPVIMSATPPPGITDVFEDSSEERRDPSHPLGRRQLASKPTRLEVVNNATGKRATISLANALAKAASELINEERLAIVVFVNRVATARETHKLLSADYGERAILLTGRMRPIDRDAVIQHRLNILRSDRSDQRSLPEPLVVVATQTLEVGADLDFDGLVTECASLDALRQRLGRLNRMGRAVEAKAVLLIRGDQVPDATKNKIDPIYDMALTKTWAWLKNNKDENGEVDFGIACLGEKLPKSDSLAGLYAPSADAPVMLPAHVDCWAQTAPEPQPSPDVAPFLHGPREGAADVQVCWRADLDLTDEKTQENAIEALSLCPPGSSETLPVPVGMFKNWLAGSDLPDDSGDVEGVRTEYDMGGNSASPAGNQVIRWYGNETKLEHVTADPSKIRSGDVVVIPVNHPGPRQLLGDLPADANLDVGDQAYRLTRAKPVLRLHPILINAWPAPVTIKDTAHELLKDLERKHEEDPAEVADALHNLLAELSNLPDTPWLSEVASELHAEFSRSSLRHAYHIIGGNSVTLVGRRRIAKLANEADSFSDEDDTTASGISHRNGQPVLLGKHLPGVEAFARRHAAGCGLPDDLVEAVARAGLLHDLGKADPRFQSLLGGGAHCSGGKLLAKSARMPRTRAGRNRAHENSGYPKGWRHELLSVRMVESAPGLLPENNDLGDLVLHLVASHHGHCRPFAPVVFDEQNISVEFELCGHKTHWCGPTGLERLDSAVADRYWRLVRRYGWWGLAWLEALLRLADWRRSEWEETHNDDG